MKLTKVRLTNIRNHKKIEIKIRDNNLILGENAVGKTTIAEVIHYCCFFKSFRTNNIYDLINLESDNGQIVLEYEDEGKKNEIKVNFFNNKKKIFYNDQEVKNLYDILYKFNVIVISPSNIDLIDSSPAKRRNYINMFISQIDQDFLKNLIMYKKLLKIKSQVLKEYKLTKKIDFIYLNLLNEQLFSLDTKIIKRQNEILTILNSKINDIITYVSNQTEYVNIKNIIMKENKTLDQIQKEELKFFSVVRGNHLNDFEFTLNDKLCKKFASQGQKRLITLSFFIAQNYIILEEKNKNPLIIFDDVYLDLDFKRQIKLMDYIEKSSQTIYITTNLEKMEKLTRKEKKYNIIEII